MEAHAGLPPCVSFGCGMAGGPPSDMESRRVVKRICERDRMLFAVIIYAVHGAD